MTEDLWPCSDSSCSSLHSDIVWAEPERHSGSPSLRVALQELMPRTLIRSACMKSVSCMTKSQHFSKQVCQNFCRRVKDNKRKALQGEISKAKPIKPESHFKFCVSELGFIPFSIYLTSFSLHMFIHSKFFSRLFSTKDLLESRRWELLPYSYYYIN